MGVEWTRFFFISLSAKAIENLNCNTELVDWRGTENGSRCGNIFRAGKNEFFMWNSLKALSELKSIVAFLKCLTNNLMLWFCDSIDWIFGMCVNIF